MKMNIKEELENQKQLDQPQVHGAGCEMREK